MSPTRAYSRCMSTKCPTRITTEPRHIFKHQRTELIEVRNSVPSYNIDSKQRTSLSPPKLLCSAIPTFERSSNIFTVKAIVNYIYTDIIIDTGSVYNLVHKSIATNVRPVENPPVLRTIGNSSVLPTAVATVSLVLNRKAYKVEALVIENLPACLLLGFTFLQKNKAKFDCVTKRIILNDDQQIEMQGKVNQREECVPQQKIEEIPCKGHHSALLSRQTARTTDNVTYGSVIHRNIDLFSLPDEFCRLNLLSCDLKSYPYKTAKKYKTIFNNITPFRHTSFKNHMLSTGKTKLALPEFRWVNVKFSVFKRILRVFTNSPVEVVICNNRKHNVNNNGNKIDNRIGNVINDSFLTTELFQELPNSTEVEPTVRDKIVKIILADNIVYKGNTSQVCKVNLSKVLEDGDKYYIFHARGSLLGKNRLEITGLEDLAKGSLTIYNYGKTPVKLFKGSVIGYLNSNINGITEDNVEYKSGPDSCSLLTYPLDNYNINTDLDSNNNYNINTDLDSNSKYRLRQLLNRNRDVMSFDSSKLGLTHMVQHSIETGDNLPVTSRPYRVSFKERQLIKDQIDAMLQQGIIRPSDSEYASPVKSRSNPKNGEVPLLHARTNYSSLPSHPSRYATRSDKQEQTILVYRVTPAGMQPDPTRVQGITKFPTPRTVKDAQSCLVGCHGSPFLTCYLHSMKSPNKRLLRWSLKLMEYSYVVVHQKGTRNKVADALSRCPCQVATICDETKATDVATFIATPSDIVHLQTGDTRIQDIIATINDPDSAGPALNKIIKKYEIKNGILYRRNDNNNGKPLLLVIPFNLRHEILYSNHNDPISGHLGIARTLDKIRRKFYWDGLVKDVKNYIRGCPDCQTRKGPTNQRPAGLLHPIEVGLPFERVGIDLLGPFKRTGSGKTFVVVATDYATRWVAAKAIPSGKAEPVAKFIVEQIICRHGSPKYLLSDRGTVFLSKMVTEVLQLLGTRSIFTTAYKLSTNGLTERFNKTLADMLNLYTSTSQKDWNAFLPRGVFAYNTTIQESTRFTPFKLVYGRKFLPRGVFAYNTTIQESTRFTPFKLVYGRNPVLPDEAQLLQEMFTNYGVQTQDTVLRIREQAQKNIQHQQQRDKERYDKKHKEVSFNIGDKVKVRTPLRQVGKSEKLFPKYFGPYTVVEKRSDVNYVIETGSGNRRKRDVIHVSRIVPYYDPVVM
ncbi:Integrase core domain [Popillia japonica]|uniref:RNA-directed DNA polymerase n=1 Tax=Popillia japonica TaxID=7064 RepID=A0AAW1L9A9_POPJA